LTGDLNASTQAANALTAALNRAAAAARSLAAAKAAAGAGGASGKAYGGSFYAGTPNIPRYANGGSFMVGGASGVDQNLVTFMASANERVTVETAAQQRRSREAQTVNNVNNISITIPGVTDADSFRRSQGQIAADLASAVMAGASHGR